jgi:lipopolysaccharide/colanic/teichoic acid biosynthesis glycosyltransferase
MTTKRKSQFLGLLLGDAVVFIISLWISLALRNLSIPSQGNFLDHLAPFSLLFVVWVIVFFIAGLYDRYTLLITSKLPSRVISSQVFNMILASVFFYSVPYFGLTPKITLFLDLIVSTILIALWRLVLYPRVTASNALPVLILAEGEDIDYLKNKLAENAGNSPIKIVAIVKPSELANVLNIKDMLKKHDCAVVALDLINPHVQKFSNELYSLIFSGVQFVEVQDLYEDTTDKVPLGLINEMWFLEHASIEPNFIYDSIKRLMDICISLPLMIVPVVAYPFVWLFSQFGEHKGPVFIFQQRIGQQDKLVDVPKFRSMTVDDAGVWVSSGDKRITKFGSFLRKSRLDEFPQLWSILKGDSSLIGPRPELPKLVELYKKEIPHYNVRHLIKPGLSGWAQIHHEKPPHSVEETKEKLAYDLYYIKHRSVWLDLKIALQTVKTLLSRVGV